MRFPYKVEDFKSIQRNLDYLVSWFRSFSVQRSVVVPGPWGTTTPPTATSGISFTVRRDCNALLICEATGFSLTAGQINVDMYLDGVVAGSALLNANTANPPAHNRLGPCFIVEQLKAGTHYVWYRQTAGSSDTGDYGQIAVVTMPL